MTGKAFDEEFPRLLQSASLAVAEAASFDAALEIVLGAVCAATGWAYGDAWIPDAIEGRLKRGPAWHGDHPGLAAFAEQSRTIGDALGTGLAGRAWQTRQSLWAGDLAKPETLHGARGVLERNAGIRSLCAVPICVGEDVLAVLRFATARSREPKGPLAIVTALAARLGAALERKRIEEGYREKARLLETVQEVFSLGSWVSDPAHRGRLQWSREVYRIFGLAESEFDNRIETFFSMIHPDDRAVVEEASLRAFDLDQPYRIDHRIIRRDGTVAWVHERGEILRDSLGRPLQMLGVIQDITEARVAQERLVQAQKMEAIGNLTGGLAHDFNNLLGIIIGNLDLLRPQIAPQTEALELLEEVLDAAIRGADLTRRLLAFARRQPLQPLRIEINELVAGITKLLSRTLGENIEISLDLAGDVWPVVADPAQLSSILANLATNARDAMPRGGRLVIATSNRVLDATYGVVHPEVTPGDYVAIEVSDSGTGMPPEVISRIYEPFFTTKERAKGTGLGLSMVFGFIKQSGGHINVYSEQGVGTTFRLYLPRASAKVEAAGPPVPPPPGPGGGEIVLVVEDNAALRRVVVRQLQELGYRVLEAENAPRALGLLESERADLLFTDIIMPGGMDGAELARIAVKQRPALKVVLTSGFPDAKLNRGLGRLNARLLSKPYRKEDLARMLREALDT